jgi:threonylcarbamoyladenosine tRNA methylthiotransferase MtaB
MHRRYDTALFAQKIATVKAAMPEAFIGVDVIVGTRGETADYFEDAYRFIAGLDIAQLHVFSYSERPGTKALEIPHVVTPQEKHTRSQRLLALSEEKRRAFYAAHRGTVRPVLWEHAKEGTTLHGFTDNYIRVALSEADGEADNTITAVRLGDFTADGECLVGYPIRES